ncbi:hypothetical protein L7F22_039125 [Adiantum nelumboides]|nr:hypothetical protein [Adiantum nelumboides]
MQGSSYEKERADAKADRDSLTPSRSNRTAYQQDRSLEGYEERRTDSHQRVQEYRSSQQQQQPSEQMSATMRDRYRFHDEDVAGGGVATTSSADNRQAISPSSLKRDDWHYTNQQSSASGMKRRHSQRSPSRPRSQQGSQAAQIANIKEVERENDTQRTNEKGGDGSVNDDDRLFRHNIIHDSPRKTPRLDQHTSVPHGHLSEPVQPDWQNRRGLSHHSETESTSASSRLQMSHSRTSSTDDDPRRSLHTSSTQRRTGTLEGNPDEPEQGPNYTWQQQERAALASQSNTRPMGGERSEQENRFSNLPPLFTGYASGNAPSSAPTSAANADVNEQSLRYNERSSSPAPRLPAFAALSPYQHGSRGRGSPPPLSHHSNHPTGLPSMNQHMQSRGQSEYGSSHMVTSPRAMGPSSMSANSPSLSQTSHQTPGQAFIHPSLAGLPVTGGGPGSKQQPSFVSKLYSMLEDDTIEEMIAWGPSGTTFSVANPAEFAKVVLPNWFKHSNWQSFVRQLNMYGFHKVNHTYQGTPEEEIQVWEFKHPNFRRGEVHLLSEIKRKSSRHKRQDSLTHSMTNAAEYEMGGTPSPEMGLTPHGHMHTSAAYASSHPLRSHHPGQGSIHHAYGRPGGSAASGPYQSYPADAPVGPSGPTTSYPAHEAHPSAVQHSGLPHSDPAGSGQLMRGEQVLGASENVLVRVDDLSDRIDAIIRHASYLENQLRTVTDQMFHSQQNEASLRAHVHHLESQMRSLSDQLYQSRQGGSNPPPPPGASGSREFSPLPAGTNMQGAPLPPASPSASSLSRAEQSMREGGQSGNAGQGMQQQMPSFVSRSPNLGHPAYANRSGHGHGSGSLAPSPSAIAGRPVPASSADAYTKLGPPPVPGNVQRSKRSTPP